MWPNRYKKLSMKTNWVFIAVLLCVGGGYITI